MTPSQELVTVFFGALAVGMLLREAMLWRERRFGPISTSDWLKLMRKHKIGVKPVEQDAVSLLHNQVDREVDVISVERISPKSHCYACGGKGCILCDFCDSQLS